ncbi:MAG: amidohydrolase family protein [Pirellulaceae bacterium]
MTNTPAPQTVQADIVIRNGRIIDGTGAQWFHGDVAIRGDRIVGVGRDFRVDAHRHIEAGGHVICPGFIDLHTHSDLMMLTDTAHSAKVRQGVTTDVVGQDGLSYAPLTDETAHYFPEALVGINGRGEGLDFAWRTVDQFLGLYDNRSSINAAMLAPHGNIRSAIMGLELGDANDEQLAQMAQITTQCMADGAVGVSTGLTYAPCSYGNEAELIAICTAAAKFGGYFAPHLRNYGPKMNEAVEEVIRVCKAAEMALHLTHFHSSFECGVGRAQQYLDRINAARSEGLEITLDMYPYTVASTFLIGLLPGWIHAGGRDALLARLQDPDILPRLKKEMEEGHSDGLQFVPTDWTWIRISGVETQANEDLIGKTIAEAAEIRGRSRFEQYVRVMVEENLNVNAQLEVGYEDNLQLMMQDPGFAPASDGLLIGGLPHPRAWGTFARYLGHYTRDLGIYELSDCIRRMTSLPARRLGLWDRGILRPGMAADVVVFEPETIRDTATFAEPKQFPTGIDYVLVNGVVAVDSGQQTSARAGRGLRRGRPTFGAAQLIKDRRGHE